MKAKLILWPFLQTNQSNSKYFEFRTISLQIYKNFEGSFVDTLKRQIPDNTSTGLNNV